MEEKIQEKDQISIDQLKPNAKYACFIEAHSFAKSLNLRSRKEWRAWAKGEMSDKTNKKLK